MTRVPHNSPMLRCGAVLAVLAVLLLAPPSALAQGCAMCGTAVQDASDPLARSLSSSVLFMMSMPFALFITVGGWLFYRHRHPPDPSPDGSLDGSKEKQS
jgi:hypothetical protein